MFSIAVCMLCVKMSSVNVEASRESVRSEAAAVAAVPAEDKRTPDNSVPNVIITCTVDDDVEMMTSALHMVDTFSLPTADEVSQINSIDVMCSANIHDTYICYYTRIYTERHKLCYLCLTLSLLFLSDFL